MPQNRNLNGWYMLRWKILERDNFTCQYCGQHAPDTKLEVDHKIPLSEGGTDEESNLVTSCYACNRGKSGLILSIMARIKRKEQYKNNQPGYLSMRITRLLSSHELGMNCNEIATNLNSNPNSTRVTLHRLRKRGKVKQFEELWVIAGCYKSDGIG